MEKKSFKLNKTTAYLMIVLVLFIWGASPLVNAKMNEKYSVAFRSSVMGFITVVALLIICAKKLKNINAEYFKYAIPTGVFLSVAEIVQKIGLIYSTPAKYAFLENLSCVVVPIILLFAIRKKPSVITVCSSFLCLVGSFILSGLNFGDKSVGFFKGEILCALAGVLYGVNIAYTGICIKKFDTLLYLLVQHCTVAVTSLISAILFSIICIDGVPIETIRFSFDLGGIVVLVALALVATLLCWFLRTLAMKVVSPTAVSIIMPFSSVITGVASVLLGMDVLGLEFLIGGGIVLIAAILSGVGDLREEKTLLKK